MIVITRKPFGISEESTRESLKSIEFELFVQNRNIIYHLTLLKSSTMVQAVEVSSQASVHNLECLAKVLDAVIKQNNNH